LKTRFKTYAELVKASAFQPLPKPPTGWSVRAVAELPELCTRLATRGDGGLVYALAQKGTIYVLDDSSHAVQPIIRASDYLGDKPRDLTALGMTQATGGKLYFVTNERITEGVEFIENEVTIWRTATEENGSPAKPEPWLRVRYPWGVGPYNHGVSGMAFGPDGALYVNSGSRTDGGESGNDHRFFSGGETDLTACIWRIDANTAAPKVEVFARGVRNAWGLAFGEGGKLFTVSNGPDGNAPEEMDLIERGKHYGFPFQFSDWPVKPGSPYAHTPAPPPGLEFTPALRNLGPAAGGSPDKPMATFDPHSSPGGFIWCGEGWPEPLRRTFLITRFGNLLGPPAAPEDVGFDLLSAKPAQGADGRLELHTEMVLTPLGRPLDIVRTGPGRALILEYTRPTNFRDKLGWLPGRIIELFALGS
jgi:glucose/arabinose dehydrogenase